MYFFFLIFRVIYLFWGRSIWILCVCLSIIWGGDGGKGERRMDGWKEGESEGMEEEPRYIHWLKKNKINGRNFVRAQQNNEQFKKKTNDQIFYFIYLFLKQQEKKEEIPFGAADLPWSATPKNKHTSPNQQSQKKIVIRLESICPHYFFGLKCFLLTAHICITYVSEMMWNFIPSFSWLVPVQKKFVWFFFSVEEVIFMELFHTHHPFFCFVSFFLFILFTNYWRSQWKEIGVNLKQTTANNGQT